MSKRSIILVGVLGLALLIAALPLVTACSAKGPQPGQEIKVGMINPTTGPAAEKGSPMTHGNLDAIEYVNTELGGVGGYKIKALSYDSAYDNSKVVTLVKRLMDEGAVMFTVASSKEMTAAMEEANRAGFPGLAAFSSPILYRPPAHIYGQTPDYGDDAIAFVNFYLKNVWKGSGKPKFALHLLNNATGYGARDALRAKADALGIEVVATEEHAATTTSEMESLTRIKGKNPDVLFISSTPAPTAVIVKNARALGMYPGVTIGTAHASFTKALIDLAGADQAEGVYGVYPTVTWGENVPGMAKMLEYVKKLHPADEGNGDYMVSWAQSLIVAEALKLAVKNAGYDVLAKGNEASWKAIETQGIQKLKDYDVGGLHGPVSYTPGDNRLDKFNRVYRIVGGKIGSPSPWVESPVIKYEDYPWFGK